MIDQSNLMSSAREDELNRALELFHFAFRAFTAKPDQLLEARGLQRVHHRILYFVGRNPEIRVSGLLAILGVTKQALHAPLRQLIAMGLVQDSPHASDKRGKCLRLTPEGEKLEAALSGAQRKLLNQTFEQAGVAGEQAWRNVMEQLMGQLPK
ncbi:transcriptional regulator [Cellvibrio zantedeschiae]|uniref:Transcriptional regulator n=1 Tax=Cellvibrio zantedeschiae TaxID=1237077 RepID=A0ABQ3B6T5_9GAMM|nr:MarR family winged helix-turn-helix transcriptional regulator [Cellvibrio zantedeschiae]GGY81794.1 transcriptional regulator [Cellvibrio zantedeschiae]